mmetsp:Transcript_5710/g.14262  ORF Transcript_5710/g.14262 Transcript_5710/m.14262 type:complete len:307 (+) Transcript_5710:221-1141(+)
MTTIYMCALTGKRSRNHGIHISKIIKATCLLIFVASIAPFRAGSNNRGVIGLASGFATLTTTQKSRVCRSSKETNLSASTATDQSEKTSALWTLEQLEDYVSDESINVVISFTTFGPVYRAVARAKHDESIILGYVEGFLRPTQPKILHLDKMEIFQPVVEKVRKSRPNTLNFGGVNIGLGLLMGYRCLLYAAEPAQGSRTIAEFLAIDDEDFQHKRLVRYYRYAGFKIVKYVGDDPKDIPDRLVWGGCGTLMKQDIPALMARWTELFELMRSRVEKEQQERAKDAAVAPPLTTTTERTDCESESK